LVRAARSGEFLLVEVRDSGVGMNDDELARAGDPFFTTKEPGRGMGLGLFLARAVIERLGGTLELFSAPSEGTLARVALPLVASAPPLADYGYTPVHIDR
jgi:two-component system sensor histidine kinase RegB